MQNRPPYQRAKATENSLREKVPEFGEGHKKSPPPANRKRAKTELGRGRSYGAIPGEMLSFLVENSGGEAFESITVSQTNFSKPVFGL